MSGGRYALACIELLPGSRDLRWPRLGPVQCVRPSGRSLEVTCQWHLRIPAGYDGIDSANTPLDPADGSSEVPSARQPGQ